MVTSNDVTAFCVRYFNSFYKSEFIEISHYTDGQIGKVKQLFALLNFNFLLVLHLRFFKTTMLNIFLVTTQFVSCLSQNNVTNHSYSIPKLF